MSEACEFYNWSCDVLGCSGEYRKPQEGDIVVIDREGLSKQCNVLELKMRRGITNES